MKAWSRRSRSALEDSVVHGTSADTQTECGIMRECGIEKREGFFWEMLFSQNDPVAVTMSCWCMVVGTNWKPYHQTTVCTLFVSAHTAWKLLLESTARSV